MRCCVVPPPCVTQPYCVLLLCLCQVNAQSMDAKQYVKKTFHPCHLQSPKACASFGTCTKACAYLLSWVLLVVFIVAPSAVTRVAKYGGAWAAIAEHDTAIALVCTLAVYVWSSNGYTGQWRWKGYCCDRYKHFRWCHCHCDGQGDWCCGTLKCCATRSKYHSV